MEELRLSPNVNLSLLLLSSVTLEVYFVRRVVRGRYGVSEFIRLRRLEKREPRCGVAGVFGSSLSA